MKIEITTFVLAFLFVALSCEMKKNDSISSPGKIESKKSTMMQKEEDNISILKNSMLEYMEIANPSYTKIDVEECAKILNNYVSEISNSGSKDEGMEIVKITVEKLNKLNEKCDFELIETSEREQIAEIIILESSKKGYNKPEEDITEAWREW
ncbi:hypothetical protein ASG31_17460 [Chryseobacterium sp. Leaf404]|uniref:hypothetical protein n=1 Tax=unclassified Chryseobacterium TaxID=2593645 RepID=UPI0006FE691A|nr:MULTISPECIES: hypothetical protein [unclassified Chryseobacterium]KQT20555.1 hypothetical protein ASG31_17460 [Chryseobacterium sp. Leaf404]